MLVPMLGALAFLFQYTPSKPPEVPTTGDYLAVCDDDAKACSDILFDHTWRFSVGAQTVGYCLPQEGDDTLAITYRVVAWLKAHPETHGQSTDPSLNKALMASYPCR